MSSSILSVPAHEGIGFPQSTMMRGSCMQSASGGKVGGVEDHVIKFGTAQGFEVETGNL